MVTITPAAGITIEGSNNPTGNAPPGSRSYEYFSGLVLLFPYIELNARYDAYKSVMTTPVASGNHKVTLDKEFEMPPSPLTPDQVSDLSSAEAEKYEQERRAAIAKARIIPENIANVSRTPLSVTVVSGAGGTLTVELSEHTN